MAQHLLIVDDDKEICALLSKFLTQHGYRVSVAHDGRSMMQTLESARIRVRGAVDGAALRTVIELLAKR